MLVRTWLDDLRARFLQSRNRRGRLASARRVRTGVHFRPEALEDRRLMAFGALANYATDLSPIDVALAPVNAGGQPDLVVANVGAGTVGVRIGSLDGTFGASQNSAAGTAPYSLVAGDFNGDGVPDLATGNGANVNLLIGNGDGTFQAPRSVALPTQTPVGAPGPLTQTANSIATGDFNADGKLDLAVGGFTAHTRKLGPYNSGYGYYYNYTTVYNGYANVLLGNGTGGFTASDTKHLGESRLPNAVAVGDLNHDGRADVLVAVANELNAFLGDGVGGLGAAIHSGSGYAPRSLSLGDVNGDGNLDTILGNGFQLTVQKGQGDGSFVAGAVVTPGAYDSAVMGDVNADGKLDLVAVSAGNTFVVTGYGYYGAYGYYKSVRQARVLLGNGVGDFSLPLTSSLGTELGTGYLIDLALADLTGDGLPDLATVDYYLTKAIVALNDGDWTAPTAASISDVSVVEGNSGMVDAVFTVTLTGDHAKTVTIDYATADDSGLASTDYVAKSGTLTFAVGEFSKTIVVQVKGDRVGELDELFFVNLSNPTGAIFVDSQAVGTILDDEPRLSIAGASVVEGNTGTKALQFTLTLSAAYDAAVTVDYATVDGSATVAGADYLAASGKATIAAGQTSQTITVQVKGDRIGEGNELFLASLSNANGALLTNSVGTGTIVDDEPRLSINSVSLLEGNSGSKLMVFTVTLSAACDQPVTVKYATHDDTAKASKGDYVAKSGTLTFAAGETTKTISITIKGDKMYESDESFYVLLSNASSNAIISEAYGWGTILNDDSRHHNSKSGSSKRRD